MCINNDKILKTTCNYDLSSLIRDATKHDISRLTELHIQNSSHLEPSVVLGDKFIELFYQTCINNRRTKTLLLLDDNKQIIGSSIAFHSYSNFIKDFRVNTFVPLLWLLIRLFFIFDINKIKKILNILKQGNVKKTLKIKGVYEKHFGYIILDSQAKEKPINIFLFIKMLQINLDGLLQDSVEGAWSSARSNNHPSINILKMLSFKEHFCVDSYFGKTIFFTCKKEAFHE